jgi:hypothetical protein
MVAVLVMALVASAAALSFTKPLRIARQQDAVELVRSFDAGCRDAARRFGRNVRLSFNLSDGRVARLEGDRTTHQATLPHGTRIRMLRTAARRVSDGRIDIPCSAAGLTRTYAVRLSGAGFEQWVLVAGITGDVTLVQDEAQLDAIFAATATRADAAAASSSPDPDGDDAD